MKNPGTKLIIAGSRSLNPSTEFIDELINLFQIDNITEIVSGGANGVDTCGEFLAAQKGLPVTLFEPDYNKHPGTKAPLIRNTQMAEYADELLVIHNGSSGSIHMKLEMMKLGKKVYEIEMRKS